MRMPPRFDCLRLQQDLDAKGWLPADLARKSGLSKQTVSRCLNGERLNARTWQRLAESLGYSVRRYVRKVA